MSADSSSLFEPRLLPASDADSIEGVHPTWLARPRDLDELSATMTEVSQRKLAVVARGRGTKLDWGLAPQRLDAVIDVSEMNRVVEHVVGDLVVRVEAGLGLAALQSSLSLVGQRLAIDEVVPDSTIGGVIATGLTGPRRLQTGAVRDLLIGTTLVRADGRVVRAGGKVVKNVAGYDLCKLYAGSYGTLGVIAEAAFRLHPLPAAAAWVSVVVPDEKALGRAVASLLAAPLAASGIEADWPHAGSELELSILIEGVEKSVIIRCERTAHLLGESATVSPVQPSWWASLPGELTVKVTTTLSAIPETLGTVARAAETSGLTAAIRLSPGLGLVYVGLPGNSGPDQVSGFLAYVREHALASGGRAIVLRGPASVKSSLDVWGTVRNLELMERVKAAFDPDRLLAPGRFVGSI